MVVMEGERRKLQKGVKRLIVRVLKQMSMGYGMWTKETEERDPMVDPPPGYLFCCWTTGPISKAVTVGCLKGG